MYANINLSFAVVGPSNAGKTAYLERLDTAEFLHSPPSEDLSIDYNVYAETEFGPTRFQIRIDEISSRIPSGYDGYIVLYDINSILSRHEAVRIYQSLPSPKFIYMNKCDVRGRRFRIENKPCISAKSCRNFQLPVLDLIESHYKIEERLPEPAEEE